jgi:hypothetical protein
LLQRAIERRLVRPPGLLGRRPVPPTRRGPC